jgi:VanZ family protein
MAHPTQTLTTAAGRRIRPSVLGVVPAGAVYESHQLCVPGRDAAWQDVVADALLALLALLAVSLWRRMRPEAD